MSRSPAIKVDLKSDIRPQADSARRSLMRLPLVLGKALMTGLGATVSVAAVSSSHAAQQPLASVQLADLRTAQRDPNLRRLLLDAEEEDRKLEREGRIRR
jgi:hypothetical protein